MINRLIDSKVINKILTLTKWKKQQQHKVPIEMEQNKKNNAKSPLKRRLK